MLNVIQEILEAEAAAIRAIPTDNPFRECAELFIATAKVGGKVVVIGVGKVGEIGKKIATTFCSVGVPSVFLHPLEAQHGDLGILHANDVMLLISNSGKTREIVELASLARRMHLLFRLVTLTGNRESLLVMMSDLVLWNGNPKEVCPLGLTPTTSTTTMAVIGDFLAVLIMRLSNYQAHEYALRHHSGYLGEKAKSTI